MSNPYVSVTQISSDTWAIKDSFSSEISIAYLLVGERKALLFDTGIGLGSLHALIGKLTNLPVTAVLSHSHFDHIGNAHEFDDIWAWPSHKMLKASRFGTPWKFLNTYVSREFLASIGKSDWSVRAFPKLRFFEKEEFFELGNRKAAILHTPGHTEDSICLYEEDRGWLFAADTAYPGPIYLHLPDSDLGNYAKTLDRLVGLNVKVVFPGHNSVKESSILLMEIEALLHKKARSSSRFPTLKLVTIN